MRVGSGEYQYEVIADWARLPAGWSFGWIPSVAVDSRDRVQVVDIRLAIKVHYKNIARGVELADHGRIRASGWLA